MIDFDDPNTVEMVKGWCQGNEHAVRLIAQFAQWARQVDDLIDEGGDEQERICLILELSLVHIAGNPFFMQFHGPLSAVVFEMLTYWQLGDRWKHSEDRKKQMFGFVHRESTDRLAIVIAGLVGGTAHSLKVAEELHALCHSTSEEQFEDWIAEKPKDGTLQYTSSPGSGKNGPSPV